MSSATPAIEFELVGVPANCLAILALILTANLEPNILLGYAYEYGTCFRNSAERYRVGRLDRQGRLVFSLADTKGKRKR